MSRKTVDQRALPRGSARISREDAWAKVLKYDRFTHMVLNRFVNSTITAAGGVRFYGFDRYQLKDELTSLAYEAMLRAVESFDPDKGFTFMTYAHQSVTNNLQRSLSTLVQHAGIRTESLDALLNPEEGGSFEEPAEEDLGFLEVDRSASEDAVMAFLDEGLGLLTEKEREMLVLSAEGLTTPAIAVRVGIARQTAYNRLAVARSKMMRFLLADDRIEEVR